MNHSDHTTRRTSETSKQESEQKPRPACHLISDCNVKEQNDEMEKVCTGIYRCLLSDQSNGKKMKAQKRRK